MLNKPAGFAICCDLITLSPSVMVLQGICKSTKLLRIVTVLLIICFLFAIITKVILVPELPFQLIQSESLQQIQPKSLQVIQTKQESFHGEPILVSMPSCEGISGPRTIGDQLRWDILRKVVGTLKAGFVPYFLSDGSLLFLVRECNVGDSDMDLNVDQTWWQKNSKNFEALMVSTGLEKTSTFGKLENFGYEERWAIQGLHVDIFASDSVVEGEIRESLWFADYLYACVLKVDSYVWYNWWGEDVRLPYPFEPALISMYGPKWTTKGTCGYFAYFCRCDSSGLGVNTTNDVPGGC